MCFFILLKYVKVKITASLKVPSDRVALLCTRKNRDTLRGSNGAAGKLLP